MNSRPLLLCAAMAAASGMAAAQNTNEPQIAAPAGASRQSDWERLQEGRTAGEAAVKLPDWPKNEGLVEFWVSNSTAFRFYVDAASLSVGADNIVRYTLIARSGSGVVNVSYEGIRCESGTYKVYAYGQDGRWTASASEWRLIEPKSISRWHNELKVRYFCPTRGTILTAAEGVDALRRGGHPGVTARPGY